MNSDITFVTGLWDIGRGILDNTSQGYDWKRSLDKYKRELEDLLKTGLKVVVFGDSNIKDFVDKYENCVYVYYPIENFKEKFKYYEQINLIRTNSEWYDQPNAKWLKSSPQAKLDMYIPIQLSKLLLIKKTSILNPFNSKQIFWIDAGYTRTHDTNLLRNIEKQLLKYNKFLFLSHSYTTNTEIHGFLRTGMNYFCNKEFVDRIMKGFFFGGNIEHLDSILGLFHKIIEDSLEKKFLGVDETYYTIMINQRPELFKEVIIPTCMNTILYL